MHNTSSPTIKWTVEKLNDKTIFTITDNGPGIKPEQLKVLYEETFAQNATTGFGLHLIKDLANAINCKISTEEVITGGTCFKLTI